LITEGQGKRSVNVTLLAKMLSFDVATRFRLPEQKGRIAVGSDADFALVRLHDNFEVKTEELVYRHRQSPYLGRRLTGRITQTILRGQTVCKDGAIVSKPLGRLVKPERGQ
jgi:allantoinase